MTGLEILQNELKKLPLQPGVYRMLDAKGEVLYVGKAKSLKKRVTSYTKLDRLPDRLKRMVSRIAALEVVLTRTEAEALLLEGNLIKEFRPHFNILLKDDKSFPFILLAGDHEWPRLMKHRGAKNLKGDYYGPFASGLAVNLTLNILERAFLLRTCSDAVFANRTRPCLLYQIKRCSGPCAGRITPQAYQALVAEARDFLSGRSQAVQQGLAQRMEEAAEDLEYEKAAEFRDRIQALSRIQARQDISLSGIADADVAAIHLAGGKACVQVFFFRAGQNFGNRAYFPAGTDGEAAGEVLQAFLGQFYANRPPPPLILLSTPVPEVALIAEALSLRAGRKVELAVPERGDKKKAIDHALVNAREALTRRLSENAHTTELLEKLGELAGLEAMPERIEVFDNSHVMGTSAVGAMIVAGPEGFIKSAYRRFNIKNTELTPGDDFGMMREVMSRRFLRAQKEDPERDRGLWPDLVLIDGGLGQLHAVEAALAEEGIEDVALIAIAKGPDRNAGKERLFLPGKAEPIQLPERDPLLYFLQRLRDEAHRFAIGSHRAKRSMAIGATPLDDVEGIGAGRKKALLNHFGSGKAVTEAPVEELMKVPGISRATAKKIHDRFHGEG
ncbi:MAG: excinuclease ABC subunit UvrC [Rhodospirillales bacterium]|nr:excinuclease ABC subunit UvrC [Rhodospirillales bacterium]MDK9719621.1 excinuclease ABC subunit UvrC [Rhodospirillales bacterium]